MLRLVSWVRFRVQGLGLGLTEAIMEHSLQVHLKCSGLNLFQDSRKSLLKSSGRAAILKEFEFRAYSTMRHHMRIGSYSFAFFSFHSLSRLCRVPVRIRFDGDYLLHN